MLVADKPPSDEAVIEHFGVKGMHWGERKAEETSSRKKAAAKPDKGKVHNPYALDANDHAILKAAGLSESDSDRMHAKYGPGSLDGKEQKHGLSDSQKKVITGVAIGVGVAAIAYGMRRYGGQSAAELPHYNEYKPRQLSRFQKAIAEYDKASLKNWAGYSPETVANLSTERIHIPKGGILRRLSSVKETEIRPHGFYAAFDDADVDRYKAILPTFWKRWGLGGEGYVVHLRANADVKAPSPKETLDIFKGILDDEVKLPHMPNKIKVRDMFSGDHPGLSNEAAAARMFPQMAAGWVSNDDPVIQHFFSKVKAQGFNALVDMNDAGALSKTPLRLLDGGMFSVDKHEPLTREAIKFAQDNIQSIVHSLLAQMGLYTLAGEAFLAHDGVKGMHWGVRKIRERSPVDPAVQQRRKEVLVKASIAAGAVAVGMILLKRGGFKMSTPASRKIALGGAKMSLKILTKSGRIMATTSAKIGTTAGKTALKGGAKVGTLAAKGSYSGAIAGSKAAGRAIAQNGSKFYERGIKNTARAAVKLGSHAMYKFTGRGTPIVNEVAKKSINLSPTDFLLNVRADQWRGR